MLKSTFVVCGVATFLFVLGVLWSFQVLAICYEGPGAGFYPYLAERNPVCLVDIRPYMENSEMEKSEGPWIIREFATRISVVSGLYVLFIIAWCVARKIQKRTAHSIAVGLLVLSFNGCISSHVIVTGNEQSVAREVASVLGVAFGEYYAEKGAMPKDYNILCDFFRDNISREINPDIELDYAEIYGQLLLLKDVRINSTGNNTMNVTFRKRIPRVRDDADTNGKLAEISTIKTFNINIRMKASKTAR